MAARIPVGVGLALALVLAVLLTRVPLFEPQLFSFDDVNLTYAVDEIDVRKGQPQPPGYPLFVLEMRLVRLLQVKRPESVLQVLSLAGSAAAVATLAWGARSMVGAEAAGYAAILLLLHPAFWYAGLTSALRVQLALFSSLIGLACWRAATSGGRWPIWASLALGIGAGVRPELGVIFLPVWLWGVRRDLWRATAVLTVTGLAWLIPLMLSSGGLSEYWRFTTRYLADQSSVSNGAFGAPDRIHQRTLTWLIAWVFCAAPAWLPALIAGPAVPPASGSGRRPLWIWLWLWIALPLAFSATVHVADPGQTLAILPPLCLVGGLALRAAEERLRRSPEATAAFATVFGAALIPSSSLLRDCIPSLRKLGHPRDLFLWLAAAGVLAGGASRRVPWTRLLPGLLLLPAVLLGSVVFFYPHWYYRGAGPLDQILDDLHSGLHATTYTQMRETALADHRVIEAIRKFVLARPERTLLIWQDGPAAWRKLSFYFPRIPIAVCARRELRPDSPPVIHYWRRDQSIPPPRLEAGWQVIWVTNSAEPVRPEWITTDHGVLTRGPYQINW